MITIKVIGADSNVVDTIHIIATPGEKDTIATYIYSGVNEFAGYFKRTPTTSNYDIISAVIQDVAKRR